MDHILNIMHVADTPFVTVYTECPYCKQVHSVLCPESGLVKWQEGELIQRALPELTGPQRELLITGTCQKCWNEIFPKEDE